jgi:hypothetical protein
MNGPYEIIEDLKTISEKFFMCEMEVGSSSNETARF